MDNRHGPIDKASEDKMNASEYQQLAARTLIDRPEQEIPDLGIMLVWNALGLTGEAGEVAEHIKKGVFHRHGIDRAQLKKEIGDTLWYAAALCTKLELDMGEVMQANIDKLRQRYPAGYSSADSQRRVDVDGQADAPAVPETPFVGMRAHVDTALYNLLHAMAIVETMEVDPNISILLGMQIGSMQRLQSLINRADSQPRR